MPMGKGTYGSKRGRPPEKKEAPQNPDLRKLAMRRLKKAAQKKA